MKDWKKRLGLCVDIFIDMEKEREREHSELKFRPELKKSIIFISVPFMVKLKLLSRAQLFMAAAATAGRD